MKKTLSFLAILFLLLEAVFGKDRPFVLAKDSLKKTEYGITRMLLYKNGDDRSFALKNYQDRGWDTVASGFKDTCWFRFHFRVHKQLTYPLCLVVDETGNFEIYLDGKPLYFDTQRSGEMLHYRNLVIPFNYIQEHTYTLAIRYKNNRDISSPDFSIALANLETTLLNNEEGKQSGTMLIVLTVFFLSIGFIHFLIYYFYRSNRSNLFFFLFSTFLGLYILNSFLSSILVNAAIASFSSIVSASGVTIVIGALLLLIYSLFYEKYPGAFRYLIASCLLAALLQFTETGLAEIFTAFVTTVVSLEIFRTVILAFKQKKRGSTIIGTGVIIFISMVLLIIVVMICVFLFTDDHSITVNSPVGGMLFLITTVISILSIPVSTSVYLAKDFAETNVMLEEKLNEVKLLSVKSIEQEKEKQKILESQKENLEMQVAERTVELAEKNKDITDSIKYAKRIQEAMLPAIDSISSHLPDSFILYKPKDIISGDFYWFAEKDRKLFVAAADCTGHGVPGALMSMIGSTLLNEIINEKSIYESGKILYQLREGIIRSLKQTGAEGESRDGMDISLCVIDRAASTLQFSGANNPLWLVKGRGSSEEGQVTVDEGDSRQQITNNQQLIEIKGDKQPIGIYTGQAKPFTTHTLSYQKEDVIYLFTDGYADQFGGPKGKKFKYSQLQQLLVSNSAKSIQQQKQELDENIESWKGTLEQIDDILVIGIRL